MMKVRTARRSTGGVAIRLISRTPVSASCSVRGIGVAVSVSTCTSAFSAFSFSLWETPKCCSSSTISRPRSANVDAFGEQRVGADDDVDVAIGQAALDLGRILRGDHARQLADAAPAGLRSARRSCGNAGAPAASSAPRRRPALPDIATDEGGAQRDLGLAEADIAADQPVHRLARGQILQHVGDGASLVVGFGKREAGAELVPGAFGRVPSDIGIAHAAFGGDADQLAGHVADALLHARLARSASRRRPACRARRPASRCRSATAVRCSRPAGTVFRCRRRSAADSHAARCRRVSVSSPS